MIAGYYRKREQDHKERLIQSGASRIVSDGLGTCKGLDSLLAGLEAKDKLIIPDLSDLGPTIQEILKNIHRITRKGCALEVLTLGKGPLNPDQVQMCVSLLQAGWSSHSELTKAGMAVAGSEGRTAGRPPKIPRNQYPEVVRIYRAGWPVRTIAKRYGVHRRTIDRILDQSGAKVAGNPDPGEGREKQAA